VYVAYAPTLKLNVRRSSLWKTWGRLPTHPCSPSPRSRSRLTGRLPPWNGNERLRKPVTCGAGLLLAFGRRPCGFGGGLRRQGLGVAQRFLPAFQFRGHCELQTTERRTARHRKRSKRRARRGRRGRKTGGFSFFLCALCALWVAYLLSVPSSAFLCQIRTVAYAQTALRMLW